MSIKRTFPYIKHNEVLFFVFFSALFLRIWGIWNADSTDEYNEVFEALRVCSGHLNLERWGKRFYLYILSVECGIYYVVGWILQVFDNPIDFAGKIVRNLTPLFILARFTSAVFGTASVFMTYLVGKTIFNKNIGIIAALFFCFNVVNIELSHYARVDATLCLVVLISFYFIAKIHCNRNDRISKYYIFAGLFGGIAFQNKLPAVILVVPFLFVHVMRYWDGRRLKEVLSTNLAYFIIFYFFGLIIGNPAILFAPVKFLTSLLGMGNVYTTPINETKSDHIGFVAYIVYFYRELGILLATLATYSVLKGAFSKKKEDILLLSFMIPFYVLMGASVYAVSPSYMIPLMPFLYILTSKYLLEIIDNRKWRPKIARRALILSCVVLLIHPMKNVVLFETSISGKNTRLLAKDWIEKNIPFGSKVLMDSGKTINSFAPKIARNRASILRISSSIEDALQKGTLNDPTKMVDDNSLTYFRMLLDTVPNESYDITSTKFGLHVESIDYYLSNQYQYFIISHDMKASRTNKFFSGQHPEIAQFYEALDTDKRIKLIKTIVPSRINRGDTFYIYAVPSTAKNAKSKNDTSKLQLSFLVRFSRNFYCGSARQVQ